MKRKLFIFLMSIFVAYSVAICSIPVHAQDFSLNDLSDFKIPSIQLQSASNACLDGIISDEEYGKGTFFQSQGGLYLLEGNSSNQNLNSLHASQESFVAINGEYVYCAIRLKFNGKMEPVTKAGQDYYSVTFGLGLSEGDHPALRGSLLTNTYYFLPTDLSCAGFTGERRARSVADQSEFSKPLSTFTPPYQNNGISTSDGVLWNGEHYCKNASLSLQQNGSESDLIAEVRIPLEDVLLSVHTNQRDFVRTALKNRLQTLIGGFSTTVVLDESSSLVTGLPIDQVMPNASDGETVADFLEKNFEVPVSGFYIPNILPVPLYWVGQIPEKSPSVFSAVDTKEATSAPATTQTQLSVPDVPMENPEEFAEIENDESIFESLPDADDLIPENTEIVYEEVPETKEKSKKQDSEFSLSSSILATVTGVLLLASVVILCIYFRDGGKKTGTTTKGKGGQKKKNSSQNRKTK